MQTTKQELIERYKEKQENRFERFSYLAEKNLKESISSQNRSHQMLEMIPFGQPILVGHHSERTHRSLVKRSGNLMDKSIELSDKAEYYSDKAKATQNNNTISSDNPEAVDLLRLKLEKLQGQREEIKEENKRLRKEKKDTNPAYILANLSGNIATVKKRIAHLERMENIEESEEEINGVKLKVNKEDNRVQLFFNGKPEEEIRSNLKRNGFRWSPYNGCWQRQLNPWAIRLSRDILKELKGEKEE